MPKIIEKNNSELFDTNNNKKYKIKFLCYFIQFLTHFLFLFLYLFLFLGIYYSCCCSDFLLFFCFVFFFLLFNTRLKAINFNDCYECYQHIQKTVLQIMIMIIIIIIIIIINIITVIYAFANLFGFVFVVGSTHKHSSSCNYNNSFLTKSRRNILHMCKGLRLKW